MNRGIKPYYILALFFGILLPISCATKSNQALGSDITTPPSAPAATLPVNDSGSGNKLPVRAEPTPTANQTDLIPWNTQSPIGVIRSYEEEIREIIKKYDQKQSNKEIAERDRLLGKQVRRFFDFEELAKLTLGNHWNGLSKEQKQRFTDTFVRLVERSYLNKTREMIAEYRVVYDDQQIKGGKAKVNSTIKKDDVDVKVIYEMKRNAIQMASNNLWVIYNVIFDNLDLMNNYRSQFNRIITQKSFNELMRVMDEKLKNPAETVS